MRRQQPSWNLMWRMTTWLFTGGCAAGAVYGVFILIVLIGFDLVSAILVGGVAGLVYGSLIGLGLGILSGTAAMLTLAISQRLTVSQRTQRVAVITAGVGTAGAGMVVVLTWSNPLGILPDHWDAPSWTLGVLLPAGIASAVAWKAVVPIVAIKEL